MAEPGGNQRERSRSRSRSRGRGEQPIGQADPSTAADVGTTSLNAGAAGSQASLPNPGPAQNPDPAMFDTGLALRFRVLTQPYQRQTQYPQWMDPDLLRPTTWNDRPTYIKPEATWATYNPGDVISSPWHLPNLDGSLKRDDRLLTETGVPSGYLIGNLTTKCWIYSKPRMFVVLYKHSRSMTCLPIYSNRNQGFSKIDLNRWGEYVCIRDLHNPNINSRGHYPAVDFVHLSGNPRDALLPTSTIHLTASTSISWEEERIRQIGRVTRMGFQRLFNAYNNAISDAYNQIDVTSMPSIPDWESPRSRDYRLRGDGIY
ncbi:uncharacterized protein RCC_04467 [Ramularia collo-cygni]|uniref:DUF6590 domain-containing protein n=1 Tax=Ramularia collo-cygni TaxID=112498 RepID=A0A2D3VDH8_9PEZI|nr:uncharacterized protein RCC_04467 [Ramularia collo-cygni]CZT18623.1 uncharacterized protein RCC_04467 [Ramularia collo-cygni]